MTLTITRGKKLAENSVVLDVVRNKEDLYARIPAPTTDSQAGVSDTAPANAQTRGSGKANDATRLAEVGAHLLLLG